MKRLIILLISIISISNIYAEDGHALWLRMSRNAKDAAVQTKGVKKTAIVNTAVDELRHYWQGGALVLTYSADAPANDGYCIEKTSDTSYKISSRTDRGLLYGAYALLRKQQTACCGGCNDGKCCTKTISSPKYDIRILNHWDNPNGTCERGFAGHSIFWKENGVADLNIIKEYGRANASIGINATVLNNVNASPKMLSKEKLAETKRIADALRPYGIRVYLAVNFASPKALGGLPTADPLDKDVIAWWKAKAKEIYKQIPDFGGFLVKANSEGEPGPMDYGRTHVDGANMLADALKPYGGIVMWRAFVYAASSSDRASQAYLEFVPFDGQFRDNVIIQIKNGPIDFQPREAISPLFFNLKKTQTMAEFQITQEYTGESIHTCFLAPMWTEFFEGIGQKDKTHSTNDEGTVSPASSLVPEQHAISAVANIGDMDNWCGSDMAQANWYAFGRLAWDDNMCPRRIAKEWLEQTYTKDSAFVEPMADVLCESREAVVRYMMPLGLHHIFAAGHHYGPEPWCNPKGWREDWKPVYYHKADSVGIGFDRTTSGSGNVSQYPKPLCDIYNNVETCPEQLLLWFHHVPWTHQMHNGETLWQALCHTYDQGVREAEAFAAVWKDMKPYVDSERYEAQLKNFDRQAKDAWWWRDACLLYFQTFSRMKFPIDSPAPRHKLADLQKFHLDMDNYTRADITKLP